MLSMDDLLEAHAKGDQSAGQTYSDQPDAQQGMSNMSGVGHHVLRPYATGSIAAGGSAVVAADDPPDFWVITVPTVANVALEVHLGNGRGPAPVAKLGPGGYCRIPGRGLYVTLINYGSAASVPTVVAATGWGEMATGDVLIVPGILAMTL